MENGKHVALKHKTVEANMRKAALESGGKRSFDAEALADAIIKQNRKLFRNLSKV